MNSSPDLLDSATNLRAALLKREFTAQDLLAATLAANARFNPALNAIVQMDAAAAWLAAADSDARIAQGNARPLEGLPITVKDCFEVAGMATAVGTPALRDYVPKQDAAAVVRLRRAGAIILGKTNVPLLTGDFQTYNSIYGTTNNPWNLDLSPGGSSGGAAAAIAAGMSALELGSDLAGSIRWPAHCCGIFGLKTTWNVIPAHGHIPPFPEMRIERNPELLVVGPLARSAADLGMALDVLADPWDPSTTAQPLVPARRITPKGLRVGLWLDEPLAPVEAAVAEAVRKAAHMLAKGGAIVDEMARPGFSFEEAWEVCAVLVHALIGIGLPEKTRERLAAREHVFLKGDLSHRALQARGMRLTGPDFLAIQARRQGLREAWARFFERFDVVLCPPAPVGAIRHDHGAGPQARFLNVDGHQRPYFDLMPWACLATGAGLPAAVAPVILGADGLPRGVQIIAASHEDRMAVACAGMLETLGAHFTAPSIALP
ncbi:MAG TPA: amidase family protein [Methylocella sp.]|nr:amidase family protein [Methylocella sp.]